MERKLTASSTNDYRAIFDVLKANSGRIVESWAASTQKSQLLKGMEFNVPEDVRVDKMRHFFDALVDRAVDPDNKRAHEVLKAAIRGEHARALGIAAMVKKQNLLRDVMLYVVEHDMPDLPRHTAKLALDSMIDKSIEGTVMMLEEYGLMRESLTKCMPGTPYAQFSLDQGLSRFCRSAMDYFEVDFVAAFKYDGQGNDVVCQACSAKGVALTKDSTILLDSFPMAAQAIRDRKTVVSEEEPAPQPKKKVLGRLSFKHTVAVPLVKDENVIGLFLLGDSSRALQFTPDEVSLAEDLAMQLTHVLENTRLFNQLSIRTRAQKALIETAATLQQEIESDEIYRVVATKLSEILPCNELAFYVYDWTRRVGTPVYATGPYATEIMADRDFPADDGIAGYVARSRKAEIVFDTENDPRGVQIPGTPKMHTRMLMVPVLGQRDVLGVIEVQRYPPETFTQEDLEIAILFANHASVALENAKLLTEIRRVRDQIEMHMDLLTHDIANYSTPIMAYFESLRSRSDLDPEVLAAVERTARQVESIMHLVEMVRTIAVLRESPARALRSMDLRKAIEAAISEVKTRPRREDLELEVDLPNEAIMVLADEMLKSIFTNLFHSASMPERQGITKLSITAQVRKDRKLESWWVKVAQPNRPIPNQMKGEVLRMTKTSKSQLTGGFGIGLAAAKGIVDRYGGNMWVSDIVQGDYSKGCVFNIVLPRVK